MKNLTEIKTALEAKKVRSAWYKGVKEYSIELLDGLIESVDNGYIDLEDALSNYNMLHKALLNGAYSWSEYSWGGCSLIYDHQIAGRLCNPSEYKKTDGGNKRPNKSEEWLDVQARALNQAAFMIWGIAQEV